MTTTTTTTIGQDGWYRASNGTGYLATITRATDDADRYRAQYVNDADRTVTVTVNVADPDRWATGDNMPDAWTDDTPTATTAAPVDMTDDATDMADADATDMAPGQHPRPDGSILYVTDRGRVFILPAPDRVSLVPGVTLDSSYGVRGVQSVGRFDRGVCPDGTYATRSTPDYLTHHVCDYGADCLTPDRTAENHYPTVSGTGVRLGAHRACNSARLAVAGSTRDRSAMAN